MLKLGKFVFSWLDRDSCLLIDYNTYKMTFGVLDNEQTAGLRLLLQSSHMFCSIY